jgi:uncharacterized protein
VPDSPVGPPEPMPVTVVVSRLPRPGAKRALSEWGHRLNAAASGYPGFMHAQVLPSSHPDRDVVLAMTFDTAEHLSQWERRDLRSSLPAEAVALGDGPARSMGLPVFDSLFGHASRQASPARWKPAVVILVAVHPLSLLLNLALAPHLGGLPIALRSLVSSVVLVTVMSWVMVPLVARLLRAWLNPSAGHDAL